MALDVSGHERTPRDDGQMLGAGEVERRFGEVAAETAAFKFRRDFRVLQDDAVWKAPVGQKCKPAVGVDFKLTRCFIIDYGNGLRVA